METVGKRINSLRKKSSETQQQSADAIGIEKSTLSRYENDRRDSQWEILRKIALHYNTSADYILLLSDSAAPPDWDKDKARFENDYPTFVQIYNQLSEENKIKLFERAEHLLELQIKTAEIQKKLNK